jgi:hypothetical protein
VLDDGASAAGAAMAAATSSAQAAMEPCIAASGSTGWMIRPRTALANIAACSPAPLATYDTRSSVRREEMGLEKRRRWHVSMILHGVEPQQHLHHPQARPVRSLKLL